MNKCPKCGTELIPVVTCKNAVEDLDFFGEVSPEDRVCKDWNEDECPELECFEPIQFGWHCPKCNINLP